MHKGIQHITGPLSGMHQSCSIDDGSNTFVEIQGVLSELVLSIKGLYIVVLDVTFYYAL